MKIDLDYLKKLLEACEAVPTPIFDIDQLKAAGLDYDDDQFVFHIGILIDDGFVERDDREPGFGLVRGADGHIAWAAVPLRLTARGHRFIEALRDNRVWPIIKRDFKDASLTTLSIASTKLFEIIVSKALGG